jgi:succinate dehydrogenase / fumarate reductase, membrane anchor subunit
MSTPQVAVRRGAGSLEANAWFFMRGSGVLMLFIAVGHLLYMHMVTGVDNIDYRWILQRWANPVWRLYDWLLLAFALAHGTNGVRTVLDDYIGRGIGAITVKWALYAVAFGFFIAGSQIILNAPKP